MQLGRTRNGCLEILYYPYECTILDELRHVGRGVGVKL
jgi:hypothetical protein